MKKRDFCRSAIVLASLAGTPLLHAQARDAALVVGLSGTAHYRFEAQASRPLQPFTRLRHGEEVDVAAGARLSLAYLEPGVLESWSGPAQFKVGTAASALVRGTPALAQALPRTLVERVSRAPEVLADLRNRQGLVIAREITAREPVGVQQARADGEAVKAGGRSNASQDLPDLNLFLALYEARQYRSAEHVIDELRRRQPADAVVAELASEFKRVLRKAPP